MGGGSPTRERTGEEGTTDGAYTERCADTEDAERFDDTLASPGGPKPRSPAVAPSHSSIGESGETVSEGDTGCSVAGSGPRTAAAETGNVGSVTWAAGSWATDGNS